jgi:hypothetical protein
MNTVETPSPPMGRWLVVRSRINGHCALALLLWQTAGVAVHAQLTPEYEQPPLLYSESQATNAVTRLQVALETGAWVPPTASEEDLLRNTLDALCVPIDSQVLVFSKTSLQRKLIHPRNPRALYFSDDTYVGWVPGGLMEIAATDAHLGIAFHSLKRIPSKNTVQILRDPECLNCHAGPLTGQWPGLMIRSVFVDDAGEPITSAGGFVTTHASPLSERWGGWYVTGQHGAVRHLGNSFITKPDYVDGVGISLDRASGANRMDLSAFFPPERYPGSDSDLVALMVLEHQVEMHNRLIRASLRSRRWLHYQSSLRKELGQPASSEPTGSARVVIDSESARILEHLLFCDEASLPEGGVRGNDAFPDAFARNRRTDSRGRSLKDLDLQTRLFKFRCSYMIYSQAFDNLPDALKTTVYRSLHHILAAEVPPPRYAHLAAAEREAIQEILRNTKPDLAAAWADIPPPEPKE